MPKSVLLVCLLCFLACFFCRESIAQSNKSETGDVLDFLPAIIATYKRNSEIIPEQPVNPPQPPVTELGNFRIFKVNTIGRSSNFMNQVITIYDSQNRGFQSTIKFLVGPLAPRTNISTTTYNALGNFQSTETVVDVNGAAEVFPKQFSYDSQSRLIRTTQTNLDGSLSILEFQYSINGRLSNALVSSSANGQNNVQQEQTFGYDSAGRISSNRIVQPNLSDINHEHTYDSSGNLTKTVIVDDNSRTVINRLPRIGNKQIQQVEITSNTGEVQRYDEEYFYESGACHRIFEQNHPGVVAAATVGRPHSLDFGCIKR